MEISTFSAKRNCQSWIIPQALTHSVEHRPSGQICLEAKDRSGKVYRVRLSGAEVIAICNGYDRNIA